jgi:hypothetical protein
VTTAKHSVTEVLQIMDRHKLADQIVNMWTTANTNRRPWLDQKKELRDYIFATDTTTTSNSSLPWKNKTTLPKLCQIRDNLHANYMSALFPSDDWMKWEGHSQDGATEEKRQAIQAYMQNKARMSNLATTVSQLLYDYIDYGNCFFDTVFVSEFTEDDATGERIPGYIGPKLVRISPLDIVFDPLAATFYDSWKIVRSVKTLGELAEEAATHPEMGYNQEILDKVFKVRQNAYGFTAEDLDKAMALEVDGFGTYSAYIQSDYVEILEFEGSIFDRHTMQLHRNQIITVVDRNWVVRQERIPSWMGKSSKGHVGWRLRPDNAYAMGPLDNLVGMQYRIDHLENLKADALDLAIMPPTFISGMVEDFTWQPGEQIYGNEGAQITELGKNLNGAIAADNNIDRLELRMEEMAGAPKQAMGIRTPCEKTAFEVQTLEMAASRIFQNKIQYFEVNGLEVALNNMLELSRRNLDGSDLIRVMDDDLGVATFLTVTKDDITASGKLRPVGARHFAAQATMVQNLAGFLNSPAYADPGVRVHLSGKKIAQLMPMLLGVDKFDLYQDNVQVMENLETQQLMSQAQEDLMVTDQTPIEAADIPVEEA